MLLEGVTGNDAAKAPKLAKYLDTISDLAKGAKAADKAKDVKKTLKAVDTAKDTSKASKTKVVSEYVGSNQKLLTGPDPKALRLEAPKVKPKTDFYVAPDGTAYKASDIVASDNITKLYHYTSDSGAKGILNSGRLNPSLKANNPKDARYGNGQYFSDIVPGTKTSGQLSREFYAVPGKYRQAENYVEVDVSDLMIIKGRDGVLLHPSQIPLDISKRIVSYGKN